MGYEMKLREPLDFYAVTDHGIFLGMVEALADTTTKISQKPFAEPFHNLNRPENMNDSSFGERANLFSGVLRGTIVNPYPYWHPKEGEGRRIGTYRAKIASSASRVGRSPVYSQRNRRGLLQS